MFAKLERFDNFAQKINSMVIERTPEINKEDLFEAIISPPSKQCLNVIQVEPENRVTSD